jgi:hypothetical protein
VWEDVLPDEEPGVAWYRDDRDVESSSSLRSDDDEDEELFELVPDVPLDVLVVTAIMDPKPTKAARLEAATTMRARRAGCRRRLRVRGAPSVGTGTSIADASTRSLNTVSVTVLRDPWAVS